MVPASSLSLQVRDDSRLKHQTHMRLIVLHIPRRISLGAVAPVGFLFFMQVSQAKSTSSQSGSRASVCNQRLPWTVELIGIIAVASGDLVWGDDSPMTPECPRLVGEDLSCCCGNALIKSCYLLLTASFVGPLSQWNEAIHGFHHVARKSQSSKVLASGFYHTAIQPFHFGG